MATYYTYMTINNLDNTKCYVGMTQKPIVSGYKGSGKYLKRAFNTIGKENFTRSDLGSFDYLDEAFYWEGFYIKSYETEVKYGGYNISPKGGHKGSGSLSTETKEYLSYLKKGIKFSEEHKQKLKGPKSKEHKQKLCKSLKGRTSPMKGKHHSQKANEKNKQAHLGIIPWNKGIPCSEESKRKQIETKRIKKNGNK